MTTTNMELEEGEREILHSALEILSPDDPEMSERLEMLTQKTLDATIESGAMEMSFDAVELELSIAALDVIDPEDPEDEDIRELAEALAERMRGAYADLEAEMPEI
jgi:hypothetical protein